MTIVLPDIDALIGLTSIDVTDTYIEYVDASGAGVFMAIDDGRLLVELDDVNLEELFNAWRRPSFSAFTVALRHIVTEPDAVDAIAWCDDCETPQTDDDCMSYAHDGTHLCESCQENYFYCDRCEETYPDSDANRVDDDAIVCDDCLSRHYWKCVTCGGYFTETHTVNGSEVCESCLENYYSWCDDCDTYYADDDAYEHTHDQDEDCCESPAQTFTIRNDGNEPLANDTRATMSLPAGVISAEGLTAICRYLAYETESESDQLYTLAYSLDDLGDKWQTKDGNYTKRLSRMAYKRFGLKLSPEIVSRVGCLARDHSTGVEFAIEVTRDLNQSAEDFGHADSCYWQSYSSSRCALKSNGAFGLRTFGEYGAVSGRAWVMPMRRADDGSLAPTFETLTPDAFVVFNGYGDLSGYAATRIVSHMAGMTYRKVTFSCSPMYINGSVGYLVAPEDIAKDYTDGSLYLSVDAHSNLFNTERI